MVAPADKTTTSINTEQSSVFSVVRLYIKLPIIAIKWTYHKIMPAINTNKIKELTKYKMRNLSNNSIFKNLDELLSHYITQSRISVDKNSAKCIKNKKEIKKVIKKFEQSPMLGLFCLKQSLQAMLSHELKHGMKQAEDLRIINIFNEIKEVNKVIELFFILDHEDKKQPRFNDLLLVLDDLNRIKASLSLLSGIDNIPLALTLLIKESLSAIELCEMHVSRYKFESVEFINEKAIETFENLYQSLDNFCNPNHSIVPEKLINSRKELSYLFSLYEKMCKVKRNIEKSDLKSEVYNILFDLYLSTNNKHFNSIQWLLKNYPHSKKCNQLLDKIHRHPIGSYYSFPLVDALKKFHACFELSNPIIRIDACKIEYLMYKLEQLKGIEPFAFILDGSNYKAFMQRPSEFNGDAFLLEQASPYYSALDKIQNLAPSGIISSLTEHGEIHANDALMALQRSYLSLPLNFYLSAHSVNDLADKLEQIDDLEAGYLNGLLDNIKDELKLWFIKDAEDPTCLDLIELFNLKNKLLLFIDDLHLFYSSIELCTDNLSFSDLLLDCLNVLDSLIFSIEHASEVALSEVFDFSNVQAPPQTYVLQQKLEEAILFIKSIQITEMIDFECSNILTILSSIGDVIKQFETQEKHQPRMADHLTAKIHQQKITDLCDELSNVCEKPTVDLSIEGKIQELLASKRVSLEQKRTIKSANKYLSNIKKTITLFISENKNIDEKIIRKLNQDVVMINGILTDWPSKVNLKLHFKLIRKWLAFRFEISNLASLANNKVLYAEMTSYLSEMEKVLNVKSDIKLLKERLQECCDHALIFCMQVHYNNDVMEDDSLNETINITEGSRLNDELPFNEFDGLACLNEKLLSELLSSQDVTLTLLFTKDQEDELISIFKDIKFLSSLIKMSADFKEKYPSFELLNLLLSLSRKCYRMHNLIKETKLIEFSYNNIQYADWSLALFNFYSKMDVFCEKEITSTLRANLEDLRELHLDISCLLNRHPDFFKVWLNKYPKILGPLLKLEQQKSIKLPDWISPWKVSSANFFTEKERENNFSMLEEKYKKATLYFKRIETLDEEAFIKSPDFIGRLTEIYLHSEPADKFELKHNAELLKFKAEFEAYFESEDEQSINEKGLNSKTLQFTANEIEEKIIKATESHLTEKEKSNNYNIVVSRINFIIYVMTGTIGLNSAEGISNQECEIHLDINSNVEPLQLPWVRKYVKFIRAIILDPNLKEGIPNDILAIFDKFYTLLVKKYGKDFYLDLFLSPDTFEFHI